MRYADFRSVWEAALQAAGFSFPPWGPAESIDLRSMNRDYAILFTPGFPRRASPERSRRIKPFSPSVRLSWQWDALQSARTATVEEDMLVELFGQDGYMLATERPWLRVDITLSASLPLDQPIPLPPARVWRRWVIGVVTALDPLLPGAETDEDNEEDDVLGWRGDPKARFQCDPQGRLWLQGVKLSAWEGILLSRQWDNPDRPWDRGLEEQLVDFAHRVRQALAVWTDQLRALL